MTCIWCLLGGFVAVSVLSMFMTDGCMEMKGIGDGDDDIYTLDDLASYPKGWAIPRILFPLVGLNDPDPLSYRETPIVFRYSAHIGITIYNVRAYYEDTALEFWARHDVMQHRRRCTVNGETDEYLYDLHADIALAYAGAWFVAMWSPEVEQDAIDKLAQYGLDYYICDTIGCDINNDDHLATPWGIAYAVVQEMWQFAETDGWNYDGSLSRDYNKIPFQDWRDEEYLYTPVNDPWDLKHTTRWQPLLESDGLGFLYNQEHVTPHIGYTAKSLVFTNDEVCERSKEFRDDPSNEPNYDYEVEMNLAIERSAALDDLSKMLIEAFDDKNILNRLRNSFVFRDGSGYTYADHSKMFPISAILLNHLALYESVIAVWKEKIYYDRVRPTSIIHDQMGDELITGYAGVSTDGESYGTQTFYARDWEPYFRTMPHSEYPSASATICRAWADAYIERFGLDDFEEVLPAGVPYTFAAYSSGKEPLSTPANAVTYTFTSFSNIADICAESRLWGGMHFTQSIVAGQSLAQGMGQRIGQTIISLLNGETPQYTPDLYDSTITERYCYPDDNDSSDE